MICRVGDVVRRGRAITVDQEVAPGDVAAAVRAESHDADDRVAVIAPEPCPVYDHVGCIRPGMGLRTRTALARAGRSRGMRTPYDGDRRDAREKLSSIDIEERTLAQQRKQLAEATADTERLRERAAAARGRLEERRANDLDTVSAGEQLEDVIRELSAAETARAGARQRLERARESARDRRARRERKRRLEDEIANLDRKARAYLVEQLREEFETALRGFPDAATTRTASSDDPFAAEPVPAALAIARLADVSAPIVLACDRFQSVTAAAQWLDAPVVEV